MSSQLDLQNRKRLADLENEPKAAGRTVSREVTVPTAVLKGQPAGPAFKHSESSAQCHVAAWTGGLGERVHGCVHS